MDGKSARARSMQHISTQPQSGMDFPMIVVRMATGVKKHFHIRATEWVMLFPSVGLGLVMLGQPNMFNASPSYAIVQGWASEMTWACFVLACALLRLAALGINGTFQGFGISPHMRLFASLAGALFWSQYGLGFLVATLTGQATAAAPLFAMTLCLMEILNITRSWTDVVSRRR